MKNFIKKLNAKELNIWKSDFRNIKKLDFLGIFKFTFVLIFVFSFCFLFNSNNVFAVDVIRPVVTNLSIPQTSTSLTVPISNFTATDDTGVAGYKLTETPTAPIVGDAGWTEQAPNSYTFSSANNTEPITWTARTGSGSRSWHSIASSADGTKLVTATINGYLYTSGDSGVTWTQRDSARGWWSVSSSADGMKLAATVGYNTDGYIYTSSDGGVTWIQQTGSGLRRWKKIVSSSDGMKLAAIVETGYIYTSSDGGVTWVQQNNSGSRYRSGNLIASSADGTKLIAPVSNGYIYTSSDSGATWTERTNIGINSWSSVASSADGNKLVVVTWNGYIYISSDSGVTWEQRASVRNWYEVSSSADGTKLIASGSPNFGSGIFVSIDSGITWKEIPSVTGYSPGTLYLSLSSDGTKIAIAPQGNNNIFTSQFENRLYAWVKDSAGNVSISSENSISSVLIDFSDPVVTSFVIPSNSDSLNVPITTFTANDGVNNVVGYKITENNNIPFVNDIGWTSSPPIFYTFSSSGSKIIYSWVKDSFGNISSSLNDSVFIDLLPSVNISIPQTSTSLTVPISNFTATDDTGVAGYKLTETPTAPIVGDAGWTEQAPNSYTFSSANNTEPITWTARTGSGSRYWNTITSSADGTKLAAAVSGGYIYISINSGISWTKSNDVPAGWQSIASSSDGTRLVAVGNPSFIYTSIDGGVTWNQKGPYNSWISVASSANGIKLVAVAMSGYIYTSSDGGLTWIQRMDDVGRLWYSVTSSADGTKLAAVVGGQYSTGYIYTSSDGGVTWTERMGDSARAWNSIASSADGTKLVAVVRGGYIYTSTDSGVTWIQRTNDSVRNWKSVASSADGVKLIATIGNSATGYIYTSSDSGITWTARTNAGNRSWWASAISADGTKLAVVNGVPGYIYTSSFGNSLYAWAKDDQGNVSAISPTSISSVLITPDLTKPTITEFITPSTSTSLTIPINSFTATDNIGVIGYLINESATEPSVNDAGWQETAPTEYTFSTDGNKTLYAWTKDANGNVSTSLLSNVSVDNTPPVSTINPLCTTLGNKCTEAGKILNPEEIYGIQLITGTSLEEISGISKVEISIKNVTTNKWYQDEDFTSDTEVYQSVSGANLWSYDVSGFPFTISNVYQINVKGTDLYENVENPVVTKSFKLVNQSFDTTPPIFTLSGENPTSVVLGQSYIEAGATALDETDGTREVVISGTVNTNALGVYTVNYSASDLSGNVGHTTRTVNVILASTYNITASAGDHGSISPVGVIEVTSGTNQEFTFTPEVSAPEVDPPQNYKVSSVTVDGILVAPVDSYTFTNISSDHTISVTFSLIDSVPPEITLNGDNPMSINTGEEYVEPGATAIDVATNEPLEVIISGNVNTNVAGEYKITYVASDSSGNTSTKERIVNVFDVTSPVISDISTPVISSNGAVIVWLTNEPATTQLSWGTATGELTRETVLDPILSTYHVVSLSSSTTDTQGQKNTLDPLVNYFFQVKSVDAGGNDSISEEQTFKTIDTREVVYVGRSSRENTNTSNIIADTTPPTISNIKVSEISSFGATISFETDEDTLPNVEYGRTEDYGLSSGGDSWNILKKAHSIKLTGLVMGTDYYFRVVAADKSGNISKSENQTFKTKFFIENLNEIAKVDNLEAFQKEIESTIESITPSLVAPFIEKPEISEITENSAVVAFNTNTKSYPVVGYIEDDNYDETKMNPYTLESSDTSKKSTSHKLKISNLKSNTKYRLIAKAFSLPQVTGKSEEVTFFTKASKIRGAIAERKNNSFTIIWTTDEPASSILEYKNRKTGKISKIVDDKKNTSHSVKVENLTPGTTYEVKISGLNNKENVIEGDEKIIVTTSVDVVPPFISNFKIDSALVVGRNDKTQTIVSWQTDEPATSFIYFEEGSGSATKELINKKEDLEMTTNHTAILTTLKPGKVYRFQIASMDDANNLTKLPIRTIITPRPNESIVDVIFKNFDETFNFIKNVK